MPHQTVGLSICMKNSMKIHKIAGVLCALQSVTNLGSKCNQTSPLNFDPARHRASSSSVVRSSDLELGGPPGARNFSELSGRQNSPSSKQLMLRRRVLMCARSNLSVAPEIIVYSFIPVRTKTRLFPLSLHQKQSLSHQRLQLSQRGNRHQWRRRQRWREPHPNLITMLIPVFQGHPSHTYLNLK